MSKGIKEHDNFLIEQRINDNESPGSTVSYYWERPEPRELGQNISRNTRNQRIIKQHGFRGGT